MGLSVGRSWSRLDAFEGNYRQKMTNLQKIDYSNTPTKGLAWDRRHGVLERATSEPEKIADLCCRLLTHPVGC